MGRKSLKTAQYQHNRQNTLWLCTEAAAAEGRCRACLDPAAYAAHQAQAEQTYLSPAERYDYWTAIEASLPPAPPAPRPSLPAPSVSAAPDDPLFSRRRAMGPDEFWSRVQGSKSRTQAHSGYVDVYNSDGEHVARWLAAGINVLCYNPKGQPAGAARPLDLQNPPICPDHGHTMQVYRKRDRSFFWGCPGYFGPSGCTHTINIVPRSPEDIQALMAVLVERARNNPRPGPLTRPSPWSLTERQRLDQAYTAYAYNR